MGTFVGQCRKMMSAETGGDRAELDSRVARNRLWVNFSLYAARPLF